MRRAVLALALAAVVSVMPSTSEAGSAGARLRIVAAGARMEFRTLNLKPTAFSLTDGGSRTFKNLKPDTYVVVQAPPLPGGVNVQCSDGVSTTEYDLGAGDDLTCTFTAG